MQQVPHHLMDFLEGSEDFDANQYAEQGRLVIDEIRSRDKVPIVVGGTGLYLRALWGQISINSPRTMLCGKSFPKSLKGLLAIAKSKAPQRLAKIHPNDRFRLQRVAELGLLIGDAVETESEGQDRSGEAFKIYMKSDRKILLVESSFRFSRCSMMD